MYNLKDDEDGLKKQKILGAQVPTAKVKEERRTGSSRECQKWLGRRTEGNQR